MMQEPPSFTRFAGLPKFGAALAEVRGWERSFRELAQNAGFFDVNLPIVAPLSRFRSRQTGENLLSPGPRFTDDQGLEWAMRSDMTAFSAQFVLEHAAGITFPLRLSYSGKVFSYLSGPGRRQSHVQGVGVTPALESFEFGAEIVGLSEMSGDLEIFDLAVRTAHLFGYKNLRLVVGDSRIPNSLFDWILHNVPVARRAECMETLKKALANVDLRMLATQLAEPGLKECFEKSLRESSAERFIALAKNAAPDVEIVFDPWLVRPQSFYSGLTFEIYAQDAQGRCRWVGGGGRYDTLYAHFGRDLPAVGFMLRDPSITGVVAPSVEKAVAAPVRIALPKGRLVKEALRAFARVGINPCVDPDLTRRLVIPSECGRYEFLLVKNVDVTSYLEQGVAEIAICGSDILDEHPTQACRVATFNFGKCRICLAGKPEKKDSFMSLQRPRVASKYVCIARESLSYRGVSCEILPLQGSVELASVINFSDAIVDLVETGSTLRENGLVVYEDLDTTRVQLVTTRGFYFQNRDLLIEWSGAWVKSGVLSEVHALPQGLSDVLESFP